MKVLFIGSGNANTANGMSSLVYNQVTSLIRAGVQVDCFPIKGKGPKAYLQHAILLRKHLKNNKYDCFHAHYSYSSYTAMMAGCKPLVSSLMGTDIELTGLPAKLLHATHSRFATRIIVKSEYMRKKTGLDAIVVPNGLNFNRFKDIPREEARKQVGFEPNKKYAIWVSNPEREYHKRYKMACEAMEMIEDKSIVMYVVNGVPHDQIPVYMYAADALLLSSRYEGSPNVIKEALYCNLPIVSTDVGDVKERIEGCDGCWLVTDAKDIAKALPEAVNYGKTNGREKVRNLDDKIIAQRLIDIYDAAIRGKK